MPAIHGTGPAVTKPMRRILGCAYRDYVPPAEPEKPKPRWAGVGGNLTGDDGYTSST